MSSWNATVYLCFKRKGPVKDAVDYAENRCRNEECDIYLWADTDEKSVWVRSENEGRPRNLKNEPAPELLCVFEWIPQEEFVAVENAEKFSGERL